ncbi:DUF4199 domain-containing protein [Flavobacterium sp.]|uniref:DUF4199 domain-containing protein n=1 Tax=Flavobacterium sp. TaxID=239 RepID=UPI00262C663D|nr:DUF4199 domain-containing protein [Flavobacterium sp.]
MSKTTSPAKAALPYGTVFGVIMIVELVLGYTLKLNAQTDPTVGIVINLLNYIILPAIFITLACKSFKKMNGGYATFGQCLKAGVTVNVFAAFIFAVFNIIFNYIVPEFADEMYAQIAEITAKQNPQMTSEQLKMTLEWTKMFMNPFVSAPFIIILYALDGLVASLIVGAVVKKDNPGAF